MLEYNLEIFKELKGFENFEIIQGTVYSTERSENSGMPYTRRYKFQCCVTNSI